jgi:hypothetical protein
MMNRKTKSDKFKSGLDSFGFWVLGFGFWVLGFEIPSIYELLNTTTSYLTS